MTRNGKPWVGDQVIDNATGREAVVTDVRQGVYVLRPLRGPVTTWSADSDERLTLTAPREQRQPGSSAGG
ncbi:hypothetical protein [Streptomyces sp. NRRL F-5123]|uniref:hypothetical protein n=1 Tax=Streptomyces sp. NRRL F-5123 TaxID=1463856 RepID=UPI0004E26FBD|nr:hypothetical protein [Streptomyces sp. NRRL F-5123]